MHHCKAVRDMPSQILAEIADTDASSFGDRRLQRNYGNKKLAPDLATNQLHEPHGLYSAANDPHQESRMVVVEETPD